MIATIFYPATPNMRFDERYYVENHVARLNGLWKDEIAHVELISYSQILSQPSPYRMITVVRFKDPLAMQRALSDPRNCDLQADVANFTDCIPTLLLATVPGREHA